jgi:hypothetical protein
MFPNLSVAAPGVAPTAPSTSAPVADSQVTAKAEEWFRRLQTGDIDRSQLDPEVNSQLTGDVISHEAEALTRLGDPTSFVFIRTYPIAQVLEYDFLLQFKGARMVELISFDPGGKIAGLGFEFPDSSGAKPEISPQ